MALNEKQKEGLARYLDTLSAAAVVGAVVGTFSEHQLPYVQVALLWYIAAALLALAVGTRKDL